MANDTISIEESASPTKKLASQSFVRGIDTVHQEEIVIGDGTNNGRLVAVSAANALKVDGSAVAQPVTDNGGSLTVDALDLDIRNLATGQDKVDVRQRDAADASFIDPVIKAQLPAALVGGRLDCNLGAWLGSTAPTVGAKAMASSLPVVMATDQTPYDVIVRGTASHDAPTTPTPVTIGATASAAAPADVSADQDSVKIWALRNGAQVCNLASGGTLITLGQKVMASSLPVTLASDQSALPITDNAGSLTVDAPVATPVFARLSDGAAALIGQKVMASSLPVVLASDQTAIPVTTVTPGTAATNLGKAEDAGHTSADVGVMDLGVRVDVPNLPTASPSSTNTDYTYKAVDSYGVGWVRKRQLVTYNALYRLADATAGTLSLTFTFTANANKQLATIYHGAGSTKTVKIRKISLFLATTAAGICDFEVRALSAATAPATGNPTVTPRTMDPADGAAEATCLALPTTAGSLVGADTGTVSPGVSLNVGAGAAQTTPALSGAEYVLYEYKDGSETKPLIMRAGTAEGFAVNGRCTTAVAQRFTIYIQFTEE